MGYIAIAGIILSAAQLAVGIAGVAKEETPGPPSGLKDKHRWIQCALKNETQFQLLLMETHLDSGRYWTAPGGSSSFEQVVFSGCDRDGSFMTGVSGGNTFRLQLDNNAHFDFALGWTNPQFGSIKAGVKESSSAEDGYNAATENGNSITSSNKYTGKDQDGKQTTIEFHISAAPGQESLYVITEVRLD